MMKPNLLSLALVVMTLLSNLYAQDLNYGDVIHLQNKWSNNYSGGFLDTRGYQKDFEKTGNYLCVSTATSSNRADGSGSWKVISASGKAEGTSVRVGDIVHLQNQWNNGNGGFLDTRGYQKDFEKTGNFLCVSTSKSDNRDSGSGTWKISSPGKANGSSISSNSDIQLQNGWNRFGGGYLDTRGYQKDFEKTGNHLCVSTATSSNRADGSGTWKVTVLKNTLYQGQTLKNNQKMVSANQKFMAVMQSDGNFCVYKYNNGKQGGFVWGSYQTKVKYSLGANYYLIMQKDGNLCIYNKSKKFMWGSYQVKQYGLTTGCKLVLTNGGKLNILNAKESVVWSS